MKSKKLGRSELLGWVNKIIESDYIKIEDLSDGVGFCQIIDAFFKNVSRDLNSLKLYSISEIELKQRNLSLLNSILGKTGCIKQVDPLKLSKGIFSVNLEFLQYLFDFIHKKFGDVFPKKKYKGLKRRIEILKTQFGNKIFKNITKYLPSHLITNEVILQIEKDGFFNCEGSDLSDSDEDSYEDKTDVELQGKLDKYNLFFKLLQEDLAHFISSNKKIGNEIIEAEEEKEYYLEKLHTIYEICDNEKKKSKSKNTKKICDDIMDKISSVPDDFK